MTTVFRCDGCDEIIEDPNAGHIHSLQYFETIDGIPQMNGPIILHFHDECFAPRTVLDASRIDPLRGHISA